MNQKIMWVVAIIIIGGAAFYGGTVFEKNRPDMVSLSSLAKMSTAQRRQVMQQIGFGAGGAGGGRRGAVVFGGAAGNDFIAGQILSTDAHGITVQLPNNGGSKIVILSPSSQILKSDPGTQADLAVGKQVTVSGNTNSDGSITATMLQIRPAGSGNGGNGGGNGGGGNSNGGPVIKGGSGTNADTSAGTSLQTQ